MPQLWSQDAGGAAEGAAVGISGSHAARHEGGGFSPSHLPAILRSLAAHQQAVEALAPLATEPRRQAGEWDGRTGEAAASAVARAAPPWRSSASLTPAVAVAAQAPGGGVSFETSQDPQLPQLEAGDGLAGGGMASSKAGAEATAEPAGAQNPSAIDALASMMVAAAAAGGQGGGFAGPPQGAVGGGTSAGGGEMDGGDATGGIWGGTGGGMDGGVGGGMAGGVGGGEGDEWRNADVAGKAEADGDGYGEFGDRTGHGFYGHGFYGHGNVDALLQRRNTATSGTGNMGTSEAGPPDSSLVMEKLDAVAQAPGDGDAGGGASAAVGGFEEGEGAEGTRTLGRVSGACLAARKRRERIASQMRTLQRLVPGSSRVDTVSVLSDTIRFLCSLIHQIQSLGAEPEGYSTREAAEAAAAEVQKLVRDGVIASRRPAANQRAPSQGVTAADPAVAGGAAVAAEGPTVPGRAVAASGAVASPNAPQGSTHTSSQGPSQSMLPTVSITSPSLE
ncbi:unnamed protein product [Closterium sp. NIES-64]|nr:unnamed protein product [Closterium sp. NIES-64]